MSRREKQEFIFYFNMLKRKQRWTAIEIKSSKRRMSKISQIKSTIEQLKILDIKNNKGKPPLKHSKLKWRQGNFKPQLLSSQNKQSIT